MAQLTLDKLESWLWDSANILRGSIDSSDFKNYIFGLLFLKRANDVFEEEVTSFIERDGLSREDAEDEPFLKLPTEARWHSLKKVTENIGVALDKAFAAIERENTKYLEGVLTTTKFGDKDRLSDEVLQRLLRHFNQHSLANKDLYTPDILGDAYEYLIKQFADDAGKKGGEFYSPQGVVKTIVQLIKPQPKHKIYDPTFGSGGMLIESAKYVAQLPGGKVNNNINVSLYGQEKNVGTWAIGKMNMILHNFVEADLRKGDTLTSPQHLENDSLMLFDRVIANPPFSQDAWWGLIEANREVQLDKSGKEKKSTPNYTKEVVDKHGRFHYGIPPRGYADLAFLQHMIASLKQDGKAGVVLPHGTLFRSGAEGSIREKLLKEDLIEGIVGLPPALFYNTSIPASVWIINKSKPEHLKGRVIIIDASKKYKEGSNQNELTDGNVKAILIAYNHFALQESIAEPVPESFARLVPEPEITGNDYNLNISRYIDMHLDKEQIDLVAVKLKLLELESQEDAIDLKLTRLLNELGI
ncbi:SAM-dependent DNA methyltransferase [Mucilaginibacter pallidiroseus]|uniref:site-specific DNA-methyltransferase (adenine-specific) n=1 Tax=Mucilaginibacter pallidiroseus TaxID=2599295 RepID=A0A563UGG3_9SPHI|nr:class I SAM-dependent DNA methyltransferase [Mucilaginibacter pallidiroseus]TWR30472.1 SAM-dependent DNA methyltransferase [Mucilaginibacter pallidiroseus]